MASFDPYKSYNESTKDTDLLTLNTGDIFNIIDIISFFLKKNSLNTSVCIIYSAIFIALLIYYVWKQISLHFEVYLLLVYFAFRKYFKSKLK